MRTALAAFVRDSPAGQEAQSILRACVHCGFCLPACPTYQLLGDELDSPRGRIYLMKQLLEGAAVSSRTQLHLDRCLTCRACESACPSGVEYGRLLDIGRALTEARVRRPVTARLQRYLLRQLLPYRARLRPLLRLARLTRPLLPRRLAAPLALIERSPARVWPPLRHARRVLLVPGCVQPLLRPAIDAAAATVLDAIGISALAPEAAGCCGALPQHLAAHEQALVLARRNVDVLWPHVAAGAEAVLMSASACSAMLTEYPRLLKDDPRYAARAARIGALVGDLAQLLGRESAALAAALRARAPTGEGQRVAFHAPCTLQHALKVNGTVEALLTAAGFTLTLVADRQQCCGSAGTYSILQPALAARLQAAKVSALEHGQPEIIATANIGCLTHIGAASAVPVCHWVELLAARLAA